MIQIVSVFEASFMRREPMRKGAEAVKPPRPLVAQADETMFQSTSVTTDETPLISVSYEKKRFCLTRPRTRLVFVHGLVSLPLHSLLASRPTNNALSLLRAGTKSRPEQLLIRNFVSYEGEH